MNNGGHLAPHGRFLTLDALRGVAALEVIFDHLNTNFSLGVYHAPFGHLAVDLFFMLSGFVLSYANDDRFAAGLTPWQFMVRRWGPPIPALRTWTFIAVIAATKARNRLEFSDRDLYTTERGDTAGSPSFAFQVRRACMVTLF